MPVFGNYNFHSHTYRCGHAANVDDEEFILEAVKYGYKKYGISDHVPVHPIFYWDKRMRMHDREKEEYLSSIEELKKTYADSIEILSGFEAEYDEIIEAYLCDLRDKCDYMILGQHYILGKDIRHTVGYPLEYAKKVCKAIESGIFDIVAHPDIFMQYRYGIEEKDKDEYIENCKKASKKICEKAKEYDIPLELNLGGFYGGKIESEPRYPTNLFWTEVSKVGNKVVVGIDAHFLEAIANREEKLQFISTYIDLDNLNFLSNSYDPFQSRVDNQKLHSAYKKTKDNATCVERRLIASYLDEVLIESSIDCLNDLIVKLEDSSKYMVDSHQYIYETYCRRKKLAGILKDSRDELSNTMLKEDFINFIKDYVEKNINSC